VAAVIFNTLIEPFSAVVHDATDRFGRDGSNFLGCYHLRGFQSSGTTVSAHSAFEIVPTRREPCVRLRCVTSNGARTKLSLSMPIPFDLPPDPNPNHVLILNQRVISAAPCTRNFREDTCDDDVCSASSVAVWTGPPRTFVVELCRMVMSFTFAKRERHVKGISTPYVGGIRRTARTRRLKTSPNNTKHSFGRIRLRRRSSPFSIQRVDRRPNKGSRLRYANLHCSAL